MLEYVLGSNCKGNCGLSRSIHSPYLAEFRCQSTNAPSLLLSYVNNCGAHIKTVLFGAHSKTVLVAIRRAMSKNCLRSIYGTACQSNSEFEPDSSRRGQRKNNETSTVPDHQGKQNIDRVTMPRPSQVERDPLKTTFGLTTSMAEFEVHRIKLCSRNTQHLNHGMNFNAGTRCPKLLHLNHLSMLWLPSMMGV